MLVNDRKEIRYLGMSPQFQALRIPIKQLYRVISSVCIVKPFHICSRGSRILSLFLTNLDTHYSGRGEKLFNLSFCTQQAEAFLVLHCKMQG